MDTHVFLPSELLKSKYLRKERTKSGKVRYIYHEKKGRSYAERQQALRDADKQSEQHVEDFVAKHEVDARASAVKEKVAVALDESVDDFDEEEPGVFVANTDAISFFAASRSKGKLRRYVRQEETANSMGGGDEEGEDVADYFEQKNGYWYYPQGR